MTKTNISIKFHYSIYSTYRKTSHNIKCMERWERFREKVIYKGAMDIIVALRKLPVTKHLMDTFLVDVSLITVSLMVFYRNIILKLI